MNVEKNDSTVVVTLDSKKINYGEEWIEEQPLITDEGVKYLEEWKINLIEEHGVDEDEL